LSERASDESSSLYDVGNGRLQQLTDVEYRYLGLVRDCGIVFVTVLPEFKMRRD